MKCPYCDHGETKVVDTRESGEHTIRRRRECLECGKRFTTYERVELSPIYVIKKDGSREEFDREKLRGGVQKALEKRPVKTEKVDRMIDRIEEKIRQLGEREVPSSKIGEIVIKELKKIDKVAYVRFASVYRPFADLSSFKEEIDKLIKS